MLELRHSNMNHGPLIAACSLGVALVVAPAMGRAEWPASRAGFLSTSAARPWLPQQPVVAPIGAAPIDAGEPAPAPHSPDAVEHPDRPSIIYVNTEGGYQTIDLHMLRADGFIPVSVESSGGGAFFGLGAGVRLAFLTLGGRFRTGEWSNWSLSTIDGELGARITVGRFEPYFTFGAGYASMHTDEATSSGNASLDVHGFDGRAGIGVDYHAARMLTLGVNFTGDLLALARPGIDLTTSLQSQAEQVAARCNAIPDQAGKVQCATDAVNQAEGTSMGVAGAFSLVMGLHF